LGAADAGFPARALAPLVGSLRAGRGGVVAGVRPEQVRLDAGGVPGTVRLVENLGRDVLLHVDAQGSMVRALIDPDQALGLGPGVGVGLAAPPASWHFFDAESGARIEPPAAEAAGAAATSAAASRGEER